MTMWSFPIYKPRSRLAFLPRKTLCSSSRCPGVALRPAFVALKAIPHAQPPVGVECLRSEIRHLPKEHHQGRTRGIFRGAAALEQRSEPKTCGPELRSGRISAALVATLLPPRGRDCCTCEK